MSLNPVYDPSTHYRIEVQGRVNVEWLDSFDSTAQVSVAESGPVNAITVLDVHTDQAGIVGLVRKLHGLGMAILMVQVCG